MTNEFKTTNRGGARPGAGRPSAFGKGPTKEKMQENIKDYKVSINVLKELEKVFKELKKGKVDDNELNQAKLKVDVLNKLLPYVEHKKPVASLNTSDESKVPTHTVLSIINTDKKEIKKEEKTSNEDESDFV